MNQDHIYNTVAYINKSFIKSNKCDCEVYLAKFDVILKTDDKELINSKNIVQPDTSVICYKNKLTDKVCTGSPYMIIEVVWPFNPSSDWF